MKTSLTLSAVVLLALAVMRPGVVCAYQGPSGEVEDMKPTNIKPTPVRRPAAAPCPKGTIHVKCGLPECDIWLDGKIFGTTDGNGEKSLKVMAGPHTLVVGRLPDFQLTEPQSVKVGCGTAKPFRVVLKRRGAVVRIHTEPPESEIYVDEGRGIKPAGRTGSDGTASFHTVSPSITIEARKQGFFSENQSLSLEGGNSDREVTLNLRPRPASLRVYANAKEARAQIDDQGDWYPLKEPLLLPPGRHQIRVEALGHNPTTFEVDVGPGAINEKLTELQRLSVRELFAQAEAKFRARAYAEALLLCDYIFEAEADNPLAHRLAGLSNLARQEYGRAQYHIARALSGGASVFFYVRRHPREAFNMNRGHDSCDAMLIFSKDEIEFRGLHFNAENFKVAYSQIELIGLRTKKDVAAYLSIKVTVQPKTKKREYNFFSYDGELSLQGTAYLTMLQHLLQPR